MLKNQKIIICIIFIITFIVISYFIFTTYNDTEKEKNIKNLELVINSSINILEKNSEQSYNYYLNKTNLLDININENIENLKFVDFDSNILEIIQINNNQTNLKSKYELIPGKYKLKINHKEDTKSKILDFNVIYLFDFKNKEFNNFTNNWILDSKCNNVEILNIGIKLGGTCFVKNLTSIEYKKNFDKDIKLTFDFTFLPTTKTIDMQLTFGERLYINFDNKRIKFNRKEINSDKKEIIKIVKENIYKKFKNNHKYRIIFSREQNLYKLQIIDFMTNEIYYDIEYLDDNLNMKNKHIYDNLKISVGNNNSIILIESIEIK